ncbi:MAG: hypothetical protein AB7U82_27575 [Blastocatellales bacterium]
MNFYKLGSFDLRRLARDLFDLQQEPMLLIEEVDALESAVRRLSDNLYCAINLRYREHSLNAQSIALVIGKTKSAAHQRRQLALNKLRADRNVRRLGKALIAEERRRQYFDNRMSPIMLLPVSKASKLVPPPITIEGAERFTFQR